MSTTDLWTLPQKVVRRASIDSFTRFCRVALARGGTSGCGFPQTLGVSVWTFHGKTTGRALSFWAFFQLARLLGTRVASAAFGGLERTLSVISSPQPARYGRDRQHGERPPQAGGEALGAGELWVSTIVDASSGPSGLGPLCEPTGTAGFDPRRSLSIRVDVPEAVTQPIRG